MKRYVYRNLSKYGNCYISENTYKKLGGKKILHDLKMHGYNCNIKIIPSSSMKCERFELVKDDENDIIIEVEKEVG